MPTSQPARGAARSDQRLRFGPAGLLIAWPALARAGAAPALRLGSATIAEEPVTRGGKPVCCVSKRPFGGAEPAAVAARAGAGVEFLRRALW